nr:hypothetical protein [Tanacetum cinerariifolium]
MLENGGIQVGQNAGVQSGANQNGLVVVPGIANHNETGNVVAARAEGTGNGNQARCYNCRGLGHIARNCTARPKRRDVANHDACLPSSVNALNSRANKLCANVPFSANQKRHGTQVWKPKQVESKERLA